MICNSLHSKAQGDAATRGGRTNLDAAGVSPDRSISFTPRGKRPDVSTIASRKSKVARLHTNSFVSSSNIPAFRFPDDLFRLCTEATEVPSLTHSLCFQLLLNF